MENKEIINENELLELANRYIQLEQEFEEYRNEFKYCIKDMEDCFNAAREGEDGEAKYFTFTDYINRFKK
jgi:dGTP triphosphohydrolase